MHLGPREAMHRHDSWSRPRGGLHICLQCAPFPPRHSLSAALTSGSRAKPKGHTKEHLVSLNASNTGYGIKDAGTPPPPPRALFALSVLCCQWSQSMRVSTSRISTQWPAGEGRGATGGQTRPEGGRGPSVHHRSRTSDPHSPTAASEYDREDQTAHK